MNLLPSEIVYKAAGKRCSSVLDARSYTDIGQPFKASRIVLHRPAVTFKPPGVAVSMWSDSSVSDTGLCCCSGILTLEVCKIENIFSVKFEISLINQRFPCYQKVLI